MRRGMDAPELAMHKSQEKPTPAASERIRPAVQRFLM
jgi:hypothetical protein